MTFVGPFSALAYRRLQCFTPQLRAAKSLATAKIGEKALS